LPVAVNDDDLIVECGTEAGVLFPVDADVGTNVKAGANLLPPVTEAYPVVGHAATDDGDQPSAGFKP
jgi:hypothetical protein